MSNSDLPLTPIEESVLETFKDCLENETVTDEIIQLAQDTYRLPKLPTGSSFLDSIKERIEANLR